jgi:diacylglycerol O-acyltransferase-1
MTLERLSSAIKSIYQPTQVTQPSQSPDSKVNSDGISPPLSPTKAGAQTSRNHPSLHPIHVIPATSLLSTAERTSTQEPRNVNFRGILNLFFIILFVLNARLVIENIIRYGSLLELPRIGILDSPLIFGGYVLVLSLPYLSFLAERHVAEKSRSLANWIELTIVLGALIFPYLIVTSSAIHPLRSLMLLMASAVYAMKIISYWHCCHDMHELKKSGEMDKIEIPQSTFDISAENIKAAKEYPKCLSCGQMYMFVLYPTLVFQLVFPRTSEIRVKIVLRYVIELVFCLILQFLLIEQYITPTLRNTIKGVEERIANRENLVSFSWFILERLLKLSIPNLYIWLLMFAELFHCWLNILAELTRFGDRRFYLDWWNAVSIRDYWQKWNQPVHNWLLRHMYKPMRKVGIASTTAGLLVFIFSGIVHEYLIITPIGAKWSGLVSSGFILQLPLIMITDTEFVKKRPTLGNCMFWVTSCFTGQPLAVLLHFIQISGPTVLSRVYQWIFFDVVVGIRNEL